MVAHDGHVQDWWENAVLDLDFPEPAHPAKRRKIDACGTVRFSMKPPVLSRVDAITVLPAPTSLASPAMCIESHQPAPSPPGEAPDASAVLEMVRSQYLDALYLSKTSLAYFAKGPLSRARASFQTHDDPSRTPDQLALYLRDSLLTFAVMDKKYRDTLPNMVQALPLPDHSDDDNDDADLPSQSKPTKKRKSRKAKPGKNGLYAQEEDYVHRWWAGGPIPRESLASVNLANEEIKKAIAELRTRETELQLILVLEALALQSHENTLSPTETGEPGGQGREDKRDRSTKSPDLELMVELLIDRLCIWQSVSNEGHGVSQSSTQHRTHAKELGSDRLRDFSTDVFMPFYAARLPKHCAAIKRKLRGFGDPSPKRPGRPSLPKSASTSKVPTASRDDGKGALAKKGRRTLERVLTDEKRARSTSQRRSVPPALARSVTDPTVPGLKRETSEAPLSAIPAMLVSRSGVLNSKRFSQREVDLGGSATVAEGPSKKLMSLDEELKSAITALKKPNRGLAVKEFVESSERRTQGTGLFGKGSRGTKQAARIGNTRAVQVQATPKGNRRQDAFFGHGMQMSQSHGYEEVSLPPLMGEPRIPFSSGRPRTQHHLSTEQVPNSSPIAQRKAAAPSTSLVGATPGQRSWELEASEETAEATQHSNRHDQFTTN
ncbi:MAG: hypothetical protein M1838_002662 [Thelocarpon superellum]|nr:MAG: hypothetical protein M1838_002662 [Thelocarpon superellum]